MINSLEFSKDRFERSDMTLRCVLVYCVLCFSVVLLQSEHSLVNSWVARDVPTKEPTKLLSSSGMHGGKFISVNFELFSSRICFV